MSQKCTPKSCSCYNCTRGKGTKGGKYLMKKAERAFRHAQKQKLDRNSGDYSLRRLADITIENLD